MKENHICNVCGEEHGLDNIFFVETKGEQRKVCMQCATAIKGLF